MSKLSHEDFNFFLKVTRFGRPSIPLEKEIAYLLKVLCDRRQEVASAEVNAQFERIRIPLLELTKQKIEDLKDWAIKEGGIRVREELLKLKTDNMGAECYWCKTSTVPGKIPSANGMRGEVIGCCLRCHTLVCGEHAIRDAFKQEFKCFDCLFITLLASSINQAEISDNDDKILQAEDKSFRIAYHHQDDVYNSFEAFQIGHPDLANKVSKNLDKPINLEVWPIVIRPILKKFSGDAKKFLDAAGKLLTALKISKNNDRDALDISFS